MDPVEIEATTHLSRVAAGNVPFDRAVERYAADKVVVFGGATLVDACEVAWTPSANVTASVVAGIKDNCTKLVVAGGFTTGLVAYRDLPAALDLSAIANGNLLIKPSIAVAAGVLQIGVDETAAMAGSPQYSDIPALEAGKWHYISVPFTGAVSTRDAVVSIGLNAVSDPGALDIYVDEVRAGAQFYDIAGIANDDVADEDDIAAAGLDVLILNGRNKAELATGITCVAEQPLYPVPGDGTFTTEEIVYAGRQVRALEDQATPAGRVEVWT